jgi:hypothetical protein
MLGAGRPLPLGIERESIRPNAALYEGEIWARQDVWIHMGNPGDEFLLFERLTHYGLDKACIKVFRHDSGGSLQPSRGIQISPRPVYLPRRKPQGEYQGYHTESYWTLPTSLEKDFVNLLFKKRKSMRDGSAIFGPEDARAISIMLKLWEHRYDGKQNGQGSL